MKSVRVSARAIIRLEDKYLVTRCRDATGDWYVFPGGGQENGEDLHQTVVRELLEEVGVRPVVGKLRFVRECIASRLPGSRLRPDFHQVEIFFDCSIDGGVERLPAAPSPDENQVAVEWLTLAELRSVRLFPAALLDGLERSEPQYLGAC